MITEVLSGAAGGGVLRFAPKVLDFLSSVSERRHEERLQRLELEFAKQLGEPRGFVMTQPISDNTLTTLREAYIDRQAEAAIKIHPAIAALAALVRPAVTFSLVALYAVVRIAALVRGGAASYGAADMELLSGVLSFWYLGRVWERPKT